VEEFLEGVLLGNLTFAHSGGVIRIPLSSFLFSLHNTARKLPETS